MRIVGAILTLVLGVLFLALWVLEALVRGGTCGPSEGGGSCDAGLASWLLMGASFIFFAATGLLLALAIRRR
jgi:hypothetical protein